MNNYARSDKPMKTTAVILAAGQGTRMKSELPKVLHKVSDKPMIGWVIEQLKNAGCDELIAVLGHKGEMVEPLINKDCRIVYQHKQLGTGHALIQAAKQLKDEAGCVLVVCGDTPLLKAETLQILQKRHQEEGNLVTVLTAIASEPFGYGRIIRNDRRQITAIVEEKDATTEQKRIDEINSGTYCFDQQFLLKALTQLDTNNAQGEYYLTDVVKLAALEGQVGGYILEDFEETLGVNNRIQLAAAERIMRLRKAHELMLNGVTIIDPEHTYIDSTVTIGSDTVIWPNVILQGQTIIGKNCEIGANSRLTDAIIGDRTIIQNSIVWESTVGDYCTIGPFAYIRPQSVLADHVKVGDFVELKKSTVASGSKIPHLSYIGGAGVNIGCGTMTCNYDGKNKHQTVIEDHAFIGSNTNLVAPMTVGAGATIGAGSTLSKDVPPEALALTRAELKIKENWRKNK